MCECITPPYLPSSTANEGKGEGFKEWFLMVLSVLLANLSPPNDRETSLRSAPKLHMVTYKCACTTLNENPYKVGVEDSVRSEIQRDTARNSVKVLL
jgi:hypothetical protein